MADDKKDISPSAFSTCELIVKIDGNELNIPINFGMSDAEVRKLYPHLLAVSRVEDNPMTALLAKKESGEYKDMSEEEYADLLSKTEQLARYWYDKPTSSLLDVGIGIALDIYMRQGRVNVGQFLTAPQIASMYESTPVVESAEPVSKDEINAVERVHGVGPDKEGKLTIHDELQLHTSVAGNPFNLYDDEQVDFVSEQLSSLEQKNGLDRFSEILSRETFDETRYASTYDPTAPLDMSKISSSGGVDIYGEHPYDSVFDRLDREGTDPDDKTDPVSDTAQLDSVTAAMDEILDDSEFEDEGYDEGEPVYDEDTLNELDLAGNINDEDEEGA